MSVVMKKNNRYNYYISPKRYYGMEIGSLNHLNNIKNRLEAYETKSKNILLNRAIRDSQEAGNYKQEISRLYGELGKVHLDYKTKELLNKRINKLKELGQKIGHNLDIKY